VIERYQFTQYLLKRKFLQLAGATFWIYNQNGEMVLYCKMKAFKLREDIRLYTGEDMQTEVLSIKARQIIDFSATYDVYDPTTGENVGALQRKGMKSLIKDEWIFFNAHGQPIGSLKEDKLLLALIRRFVCNLIPQQYLAEVSGLPVGIYKQNFNPFTMKLNLDFGQDQQGLLDRRLGLAAAVLLGAIEGKQD
jgi:uncharacterized protein YxjI